MKVFTVEDPIFKTEPLFVLGCSRADLQQYLLRRRWRVDVGEHDRAIGTMFTFDRAPWRLVWTQNIELPVILHEVFHLVTRICDDKGITIRSHNERGENDDETAAYLFEHFARAVLKRVRR